MLLLLRVLTSAILSVTVLTYIKSWEKERSEVLNEVQRLKAEATTMVKILATEYEEENLSEDKKRSLSQEAYSLQMVIEMRTGEVRNLRDQLARATQQPEQAMQILFCDLSL